MYPFINTQLPVYFPLKTDNVFYLLHYQIYDIMLKT